MRRSRRLLALVVAGVLVIAGAGWAVGSKLRSPADELASRKAPDPSPITAEVRRKKLVSTVTVNGELSYGSPTPLTLAGVVGGAPGIQRVTKAPRRGKLTEGELVMEVNGRPVVVLKGKEPMYRALTPGTSGKDVRQLQQALRRLGHAVPVTGVFDASTIAAVERWYGKLGYRAQEPDLAAKQQAQQLKQAVQSAEETLLTDRRALANGRDVLPLKLKLDNARQALAVAEGNLERAEEQQTTPEDETMLRDLERAVRSAEQAVLEAEAALAAGSTPALQLKLDNARRDLDDARDAVSSFLEQAAAARDKRLEELRAAVGAAQEAMVSAEQALRQARQLSPLARKVSNGRANLASARAILADYLKTYGVSVPAGEIVFLPDLPARLEKVIAQAGAVLADKAGTVTSSGYAVTGVVEDKEAALLRKGAKAVMETSDGRTFPARLTSIGKSVVLTPDASKALARLVGSQVTVRISVGATDGEVLTVPVAAIITGADGKARVRVQRSPGKVEEVEVRTGLAADGEVEVGGALDEGDLVVVGHG
ncbi:peptidoglycan-binding protein [Nonomuraea soli]|uniref:Multidrug efflux pump subunit AcrA (Membrane-fusion protein) n=1 Tax=Nonomuraea soli TaxID=1032476 RepID=A0A7W0CTU6_9ACTN|nr:peptidoglycan-binding protein [Nonomuraea soli]MBA2897059.1 multidrug efflux pump subunit AcrA (membrane-fusion protein) [Nonomuraea soli]